MARRHRDWWKFDLGALLFKPGQATLDGPPAPRRQDSMKIGDYIPDARLGEGESVEGLFDPLIDIPDEKGALGGTVYTILLEQSSGKPIAIKGGKGLMNGVAKASLTAPGKKMKLRVTAHGEARTTARTYDVVVVR